jgi:hypothetical protein
MSTNERVRKEREGLKKKYNNKKRRKESSQVLVAHACNPSYLGG